MNTQQTNSFGLRQRVHDASKPPLVIQPVTLADPALVEIAGVAGIEAVLLDCEHGMIGTPLKAKFVHRKSDADMTTTLAFTPLD